MLALRIKIRVLKLNAASIFLRVQCIEYHEHTENNIKLQKDKGIYKSNITKYSKNIILWLLILISNIHTNNTKRNIWIFGYQYYKHILYKWKKNYYSSTFSLYKRTLSNPHVKTIALYISNAHVIPRKFSPSPISRAWDTHFIKSRIV